MVRRLGWLSVAVIGATIGCAPKGPTFHPVQGKVVMTGGDPQAVAGYTVECALQSDQTQRANAKIGTDGSFELKTLFEGKIRNGAPGGTYVVRLVPSDDDDEGGRKKRKASPVAQRYLDFKTSGLTLQVPPAGDVTLTVAAR